MFCLYCGGRLPLLRDLALGDFCSPEHREQFERLEHEFQETDPGHVPARASLATLSPPAPSNSAPPRLHLTPVGEFGEVPNPAASNSPELLRNPALGGAV